MKRFLGKGALAVFLIFGFVFAYGTFCDYFFTQKRYLDLAEKKQWVLAQEGGDWDYAVLGSSRAFGAFDMKMLDSLTGWKGINIGANGSGFKDNYLVLRIFLKRNRISRLFLQVDMASLNSSTSFSNEFHAYAFLPYWWDSAVREVLADEIPAFDSGFSDLLPQWRYFYFNKYFAPKELIRRSVLDDSLGDGYTRHLGGNSGSDLSISSEDFQNYPLPVTADPTDLEYLNKIKQLADKEGIELTFFTAPRYKDRQEAVVAVLSTFANAYIYPKEWDSDDASVFVDQAHLNRRGQRVFTESFYKSLKSEISP